VRWALAHKRLPYREVAVDLVKGEQNKESFLRQNPMGTVPCLMVGDRALGESLAIIAWLEETFPERPLMPRDSFERAWVRQVSLAIVAGTQPLQNLAVLKFYSAEESERKKWAQHWIKRGLIACEKLLEGKSDRYCLGDTLTLADLCLIPQVYNANRFGMPLESYPRCHRVYENCRTLEDCVASSPERWEPK
jgi:maleylacetoacetate isomerase